MGIRKRKPVAKADAVETAVRPEPPESGAIVIRRDLWKAFTSLDPKDRFRIYDKEKTKAELLEKPPLRRKGLISIDPIPREEQRRWAEAFMGTLPESPITQQLRDLLNDDGWTPGKFKNCMRNREDIAEKWNAVQRHHVLEQIQNWMKKHRLSFDPTQTKIEAGSTRTRTETRTIEVAVLRRRLIRAIERMPLHELASLRVPAGYFLDY